MLYTAELGRRDVAVVWAKGTELQVDCFTTAENVAGACTDSTTETVVKLGQLAARSRFSNLFSSQIGQSICPVCLV